MTNPLRLCRLNHADTAVLTTGAQAVETMPVSNLQTDDIQELWRSKGTGGDAIIVNLGTASAIGVVALINTNMRPADVGHVRVSNTDPTGEAGEIYNSGATITGVDPVWARLVHFIEPEVIGRYIRLGLTINQSPVHGGRLVVGPTWAPSRDMAFGREKLWRDFSTRSRSLGGNEFVDVKPRQRGWRATIRGLTKIEVEEQVDELNRLRGIGRDLLLCVDKDSDNLGRDTVWGLQDEAARARQWSEQRNLHEIEIQVWDRV